MHALAHRAHRRGIRDVGDENLGVAARCADLLHYRFGIFTRAQRVYRDGCACRSERERDRTSDIFRAAGDKRDLAGEFAAFGGQTFYCHAYLLAFDSLKRAIMRRFGEHDIPKKGVMKSEARILLMALMGCMTAHAALAAYPERPIRMIVPSAAGGQPDTNSRLVAAELSKQIGQQVVVDNRPGASSSIGFEAVAKAQPDGYTIGYGGFPLATNPSLLARVPYDVNKDFRMVILTNISPNVIAITPALPVNSIRELIDYAKRNPDQLLFGTSGSGGTMHLSMELFKLMTGTRWCTCRIKECSRSSPRSSAAACRSFPTT